MVASTQALSRIAGVVWYVYPFHHKVSFNIIAEKHYKYLKKWLNIYAIAENAFPSISPFASPLVLLHPYFYPLQKFEDRITRRLPRLHGIIGLDVADSDQISPYAVRLTGYAKAMIVPSSFARKAFISSGVRIPVHVLPHGVEPEYLETPPLNPSTFSSLSKIKQRDNLKVLLAYAVHSPYRKGVDLLFKIYNQILKERKDVILVIKAMNNVGYFLNPKNYENQPLEELMDGLVHRKWLSEKEQMELFDLSDVYILSSRGGGFEHPALLALARGIPAIGAKGGAWEDYMPEWGLIDSVRSKPVLEGNPIHTGCGVEMKVDKAVDKLHIILNNLDDYKGRAREYADTYIRQNLTWEQICLQLKDIIIKYL